MLQHEFFQFAHSLGTFTLYKQNMYSHKYVYPIFNNFTPKFLGKALWQSFLGDSTSSSEVT